MANLKNEILKQKINQYESAFSKQYFKISENLSIFFYDMLYNYSISLWFPFLSCILQYSHILFFIFSDNVS